MKNIHYGIFLLFLLAGCSVLKLPETFRARETDWRMWGGQSTRANVAEELLPPLKLLWEYDASAGFSPQTIVAADSIVFIANLQGEVHAVNVATGKKYGSYDFGSAIVGAPIVDGNFLYIVLSQEEKSLISYNLHTGRIEWQTSTPAAETSPLLVGQKLIVVTTLEGKIYAVEKYSGNIEWTYSIAADKHRTLVHASPASDGSVIIVGCDDGTVYCISADSGKFRWKVQTGGSVMSSPSMEGDKTYIASLDSTLYALDVRSGKEHWRKNLGGKIFGAVSAHQGSVYVGTANRTVSCLDGTNGELRWTYTTNGPIGGGILVSGNIIYFGCLDKTLYALDAEQGRLLWKYETESRLRAVPIIYKNILLLPREDRTVLAFTAKGNGQ
jgi:outer membrane protein assembly factor BamB